MTVLEDIEAKLKTLRNHASETHAQGRSPRDVPVTLAYGIDIVVMLEQLATQVEALSATLPSHHHEIEVSKKTRQTSGPLGGDGVAPE
jgi:hypothetical protein